MITSVSAPIDLTKDDDENDQRHTKRARTDAAPSQQQTTTPAYAQYGNNNHYAYPSPTPSPYPTQGAWSPQNIPQGYDSTTQPTPGSYNPQQAYYRQNYAAPPPAASPSYFPEGSYSAQPQRPPQQAYNGYPAQPQQQQQTYQQTPAHNVIDLTGTPPPAAAPPKDVRRDVVCIGQLHATALVLYPIPYVCVTAAGASGAPPSHNGDDYVTVRLKYDDSSKKRARFQQQQPEETIQIAAPHHKGPSGETLGGEDFGVVEQRVATVLGPLMQKVLIRLEATVKRAQSSAPILPLRILVFTPRGNVKVVANYLSGGNLLLEHPSTPYNPAEHRDQPPYENPHNPANGGPDYRYPAAAQNRWSQQGVSGKSVEVQRSQVDEVFKSLRSGEDLKETDAGTLTLLAVLLSNSLTCIVYHRRQCCDESLPSSEESPHLFT